MTLISGFTESLDESQSSSLGTAILAHYFERGAGMVLAVPLTEFFVAIWGEIKASLTRALDNEYHET